MFAQKMKKMSFLVGIQATFMLMLLALFCTTTAAQTTGTIVGQVSDPSGAAVPEASITAENTGTGLVRKAVSTSVGSYLVPSLPPGPYKVTIEHAGFKSYVRSGITVIVGENARVDAALEIGAVTQSVEVTASATRVDTQSSIVGSTVDNRRVNDMPLNGRNVLALMQLQPGVGLATIDPVVTDRAGGPTITVSGSRTNQNNFRLDGSDMIENWLNQGTNLPSPDAIQEFRVLTNTYDAQYGRASGAVLLAVTKSGTNEFHGSGYDYLRNDALNARNFFAGSQKPVLRQNQFGASIGGPVRLPGYDGRNRTFFFFNYQGLRIRQQNLSTLFPPSQQEKSGIFSTTIIDPDTGLPFPNNTIPSDRFDPVAVNIMNRYFQGVEPNRPDGSLVALLKPPISGNQFTMSAEHVINPSNRLKFRWFRDPTITTYPSLFPNIGPLKANNLVDSENLTLTSTLTPTLLNEVSASHVRVRIAYAGDVPGMTGRQLGSNYDNDTDDPIEPTISIGGRISMGGTYGAFIEPDTTIQADEKLTWIHGRHTLKVGTKVATLRHATVSLFQTGGVFDFNGTFTGNSFADFLLGRPYFFQQGTPYLDDSRSRNYHFFAQDDFKVTSRLTLNLGLRYELNPLWWQKWDHTATIRPGEQSTIYPQAPLGVLYPGDPGVPRGLAPNDKNDFAPRVGFAWDPTGKGRTSIRAAYGVFTESFGAVYASHNVALPPFQFSTTALPAYSLSDPWDIAHGGTDPFPYSAQLASGNPVFPAGLFFGFAINPNIRNGYVQQGNFNIQHQFTDALLLQAGYVGKVGKKLSGLRDMDQAVYGPGATLDNVQQRRPISPDVFSGIAEQTSDRNSSYHALQVNLEKRFSRGYTFQVAYTLSKAIDDVSALGWDELNEMQDSNNIRIGQKSLSGFDQRHILAVNYIWDLPFMKKSSVLGGWQVAGITRYGSGYPFSVFSGLDRALTGGPAIIGARQRMDLVGNPRLDPNRSHGELVQEYFNTAAFALPAIGTFGNSGRNIVIGPGFSQTDLSLQKRFKLPGERGSLQIRADFFNLFNAVNFTTASASWGSVGGLGNSFTSPAYGGIQAAKDARIAQLALRFDF